MIDGLKPYPAMKDSGVLWLGEVPEHWEVGTLRRKLRSYDGIKIGPFGSQLKLEQMVETGFKVYGQANVIARDFGRGTKFIDRAKFDELSACEVRPGDLVVTMMGTSGRCAKVPNHAVPGIMDSHLIRLRTTPDIDLTFAARIIDEAPYAKEQIEVAGKGSIMHGLNSSMIKDLLLALPPLPEQAAIVRFLNHADRRIRRYICAKQKLVKLLEEQKQAVIHRAVTRGLDPNVRLKPSGVEWLGDVPEHWEVLPLKRWVSTKITDGPHETPEWLDDGVPFLSAEAMVDGQLDFSRGRGFISRDLHEVYCRKCRPQRDDIFMCKSGATTGKVAIVETDREFSVWSPLALIRVRPSRVLPRMLFAVLQSRYVQRQVQDTWSYGTQPNLSMGAMERLLVALPPTDEQADLLAHIDEQTTLPTEAIHRARREIDLLREYRTRLIADVVTGKLDVREAAARLPDEAGEPEALDEVAAESDGDEALDDSADEVPEEAVA